MKEDFNNRRSLFRQHPLELDDVPLAALPNLVGENFLHPHGDDVFVVAAIKNHQLTLGWDLRMDTPQEIVSQLGLTRFLEGLVVFHTD